MFDLVIAIGDCNVCHPVFLCLKCIDVGDDVVDRLVIV